MTGMSAFRVLHVAALLTLSFPFVTLAILAEAAASLAYARLTAPAAPKPATSPPA